MAAQTKALPSPQARTGLTVVTREQAAIGEIIQVLFGSPEAASIKAPNASVIAASWRQWCEDGRDAAT
jgi:hypothetical protein